MKLSNLGSAYQGKFSTRIFIIFLFFIIALSSVLTAIFVRHQKNSLTEDLIQDGVSIAALISHNAKLGVFTENPEFLEGIIEGTMNHKGALSCDIFTLNGRNLNTQDSHGKASEKQGIIMERIKRSKEPYYIEYPRRFDFWAPVISNYYAPDNPSEESLFFRPGGSFNKNRVIGFVRIGIGKENINKSFKVILTKSISISILFMIIASVAAFILSRKITIPLKRLSEGVHALGTGDLSTRVSVEKKDEIGRLAMAFNNMVRLLKEREEEKQKLAEQLNKSERLESIGMFAGGISHDFNNILTIIQNNMHLAEIKAPDYVKGYIEKTLEATKRGSELILKLLHFTNESRIIFEVINIGLVVQETSSLFDKTLDPRIRINVNSDPGLWKVKGAAGQIQQVIMNLCINARDAIMEKIKGRGGETDANGSFHINVTLKNTKITHDFSYKNPGAYAGEFVLLKVSDDGCGMDAIIKKHIFEPFFTTKEVGKGTGIGLSSVYGIVNRLGGWINVQSEPGEGTVFDVYFPRFVETLREAEPESKDAPHVYAGGNETILLVDDEEHILTPMEEKLEELGYKVITAKDGVEALDVLRNRKGKIDLIVLDEVMPKRSGTEVLHHIRQHWRNIKVIMYSGKDLSQNPHALGEAELIGKPCSPDVLAHRIRETLGTKLNYPVKSSINRVKCYFVSEKTVPYKEKLSEPSVAYKLFRYLANEPREKFLVVYLDSQNRIIAYDELSSGTTNETVVYPKEVVKNALLTNASSVILIHNHPSGDLSPSGNDIIITAAISQACEIMDINVADHLIISENGFYSFLGEGLLSDRD
jgi:signal transduction histidine kinase/DNA-binding response OmpR family regulator